MNDAGANLADNFVDIITRLNAASSRMTLERQSDEEKKAGDVHNNGKQE
jgi:hypothetical protein